jgi:signal transduction histidine kinase
MWRGCEKNWPAPRPACRPFGGWDTSLSWTRKLLPRSLRLRLILSFGLVIFLSLFMAGTATVYLLRDQEERNARQRVGLLAEPVSKEAGLLERAGASPDEILTQLAAQYPDVRILLIARGVIIRDTEAKLSGTSVSQISQTGRDRSISHDYQVQKLRKGPEELLLFWPTRGGALLESFTPTIQTVVAVQESDVSQAWRDLLPRLLLAGGVACLIGVIAAGLLARSISRPLRQITAASEEMARGRYDQRIPSYGGDEVGRLASAFNDMAREVGRSHRTLRDFLANVSHELKTPLTSVQGFSQAMTDGSLKTPEDYSEAGRIINEEAVRMRALVDDLLYLSQVEQGAFAIQADELSPNELLVATLERFMRRARQSGVALELDTNDTPHIKADGRRLEQALANIVDNAVRHTPSGGTVTLRSLAEDGHVQLSVHNTGSYIPDEALAHVFDRFFQADPLGASTDANTGLGLAITKEIVNAHGGVVDARSSIEEGTEFTIVLPILAGNRG